MLQQAQGLLLNNAALRGYSLAWQLECKPTLLPDA
jgi:hypothetical protein